jgi:glycosyltransferase involved in cell wall biosynthesis
VPDGLNRNASRPLLLTTDAVGGVWRYTLDLAAGLSARGMRPVVAVLGPAATQAQREEAGDFGLIETGLPLDWTAESPAELAYAVATLQSMAHGMCSVHLHAPALVGNCAWPAPVVAVAHSCVATWWHAVRGGALPDDFRWRTEATATGLRSADAVIAPTAAHAEALQTAYGPVPVQVVHNGSNLPPLKPSPPGRGSGQF